MQAWKALCEQDSLLRSLLMTMGPVPGMMQRQRVQQGQCLRQLQVYNLRKRGRCPHHRPEQAQANQPSRLATQKEPKLLLHNPPPEASLLSEIRKGKHFIDDILTVHANTASACTRFTKNSRCMIVHWPCSQEYADRGIEGQNTTFGKS